MLDTTHGRPAAGLRVDLLTVHDNHSHHLRTAETNADGRVDGPLLEGEHFRAGIYEIIFHVGDYFARLGLKPEVSFLDYVPVRFIVTDEASHYHVPLLVSPFGYSTYRGS